MRKASTFERIARAAAGLAWLLPVALAARAGEWPQWRGPEGNSVSGETGLISSWSKANGQNLIWRVDWVGRSTPAVFDGRVCASGRADSRFETIACFDAKDGRKLWERRFPEHNTTIPFSRVGWASVSGDPETGYLYSQNGDGHLLCFDKAGKTVWESRLGEEMGRSSGYGGRTHTPFIDEDRLIMSVVGTGWGDQAALRQRYVAFDKRSGKVLWQATPNDRPRGGLQQPVERGGGGHRRAAPGDRRRRRRMDLRAEVAHGRAGLEVPPQQQVAQQPAHGGGRHGLRGHERGAGRGRLHGAGGRLQRHRQRRHHGHRAPLAHGRHHRGVRGSALQGRPPLRGGRTRATSSPSTPRPAGSSSSHNLGTIGRGGSPVWADGKILTTEVNGNVHILRPLADKFEMLSHNHLTVPGESRHVEIWGSFAVAYGRLYFMAEDGLYCLGDKKVPFKGPARAAAAPVREEPAPAGAKATVLQLVPADVAVRSGESVTFEVRAFDEKGRKVPAPPAASITWSLDGLAGTVSPDGRFRRTPPRAIRAGR